MFIQQGDVLIKKVESIKGKKLNHLTLAQGESTGHHHTINTGDQRHFSEQHLYSPAYNVDFNN